MNDQDQQYQEESAFSRYIEFHTSPSARFETRFTIFVAIFALLILPLAAIRWYWQMNGVFADLIVNGFRIFVACLIANLLFYFWRRDAFW